MIQANTYFQLKWLVLAYWQYEAETINVKINALMGKVPTNYFTLKRILFVFLERTEVSQTRQF